MQLHGALCRRGPRADQHHARGGALRLGRVRDVGTAPRKVWPGAQVVNCPALGFAQLAANATVTGSGTWNQTSPTARPRVPAGTYKVVVDNKPLHLPAPRPRTLRPGRPLGSGDERNGDAGNSCRRGATTTARPAS